MLTQFSTVSTSSVKMSGLDVIMHCDCELRAPLRTSWTDANQGKRFFGCASYDRKLRKSLVSSFILLFWWLTYGFLYLQKVCGYFSWFDPHTCSREMEVRPPLTKKIKNLQSKVAVLKRSVITLKSMLGVSWAAVAIMEALLLRSSNWCGDIDILV